jgi:MFS family permease
MAGSFRMTMTSTTAARQRRPLYTMLAANIVSQIGNSLSYIVIPWFVLQITGSAARMGITAAAATIPLVITGFFGGALVDRLGYKRMSVISDIASSVAVALIPLLHLTIGLEFWQLLTLVFVGAILDSPGATARSSLYPDLAALAGMRLERANSIWMISRRLSSLMAAPTGGLLIVVIGASNVLWINAASFLMSAALIALAIPAPVKAERPRESYVREMLEGLRFIRGDRLIFWLLIVFAMGGLLAEPLYSVVLPVYANEVFGSALDLGFMFAALAVGSIIGGGIYAVIGYRLPRRLTIVAGFGIRAATFWVLVAMPSLWVIVVAIVVNAIALEPVNPLEMTILQERVPDGMRGRVFGTLMSLGVATMPLGMIGYGFLLSSIGLQQTLWVLAAVNITLPALILLAPAFRDMHAPPVARERQAEQRALPA